MIYNNSPPDCLLVRQRDIHIGISCRILARAKISARLAGLSFHSRLKKRLKETFAISLHAESLRKVEKRHVFAVKFQPGPKRGNSARDRGARGDAREARRARAGGGWLGSGTRQFQANRTLKIL